MDEPLSNLDAKLRVQMRTEIARIQQQLETTTIYVTHDQTEAMTLGDQIAVMRAGVLQQVGPPSELYSRPANLVVVGFLGSPSMNFLPGEIDGDSVKLPIGRLRLPDSIRRELEAGSGGGRNGVVAGLRPEHFEDASLVGDRGSGHTFTAKIDVLESMGSEFYAHIPLESERVSATEPEELAQDAGAADLCHSQAGTQLIARLDAAGRARQGQEAELWVNVEHLHMFDAHSGQACSRALLTRTRRRSNRLTPRYGVQQRQASGSVAAPAGARLASRRVATGPIWRRASDPEILTREYEAELAGAHQVAQ